MATTTSIQATATPAPVPFTLEQLRNDILELYLLQLRTLSLFANEEKMRFISGISDLQELWDGAIPAKNFGLTYEDIQESLFARAMEQQYSFAFFGIDNQLCVPFDPDSTHTWVAAIIRDLSKSAYVEEWEQYDGAFNPRRCLHTCELANARNVLEGEEGFYTFIGAWGDAENKTEGALTIHQMALLAGMEEMTIRTAISRPSSNQLPAFKDDRRTLIAIKDAKEWLIAKGRYLPITKANRRGEELNLARTSFARIADFAHAIALRVVFLDETRPSVNTIQQLMDLRMEDVHFKDRADLLNPEVMTKAASILDLPEDLFVLRARETVLLQDLANVGEALETACKKNTP